MPLTYRKEEVIPAHGHDYSVYHKPEGHEEEVQVGTAKKYVCNGCGAEFDNAHDIGTHVVSDFWDNCENYTYKEVPVYDTIFVETKPAYWTCRHCGKEQ